MQRRDGGRGSGPAHRPRPHARAARLTSVTRVPITPTRIYHLNVNCSQLDRSLAFYRDLVGLTPTTRTAPDETQPGGAFGLDRVQWDAWMLLGDAGYASPVLDLLEWKVPRPAAAAVTDPTATGFNRLCITTPDLAALHEKLVDAGADVWNEPVEVDLTGGRPTEMFICGDPDGTQLEFLRGRDVRLSHVAINCADLERSTRYYEDVIGLTPLTSFGPVTMPGRLFRRATDVELRVQLLQDPASGFMVELVEWIEPRATAVPPRRANELGIFRMAWVTEDLDVDYDTLDEAGVECYAPPAALAMGPGLPVIRALFWNDPDGACLELIESPR
jgi:catechol 2,3-dioxygenase-like lactoylglutathione lyase family enzyme